MDQIKLTNKPIILVDGSSYLYRAYHGMPNLSNAQGQPTGAIYGVVNMLKKLLKDYAPDEMLVVFDAKGKTFRDDLYAEYKANRPPMPVDLTVQIEPINKILMAMGFPILSVVGVEADDVIGTLAKQACEIDRDVIISTGDKDLAQLVNSRVTLINTMTDTLMDVAGVNEKFGIGPEHIVDYLALVGDSSDNIPGVPKVGPKTAVKWLREYGSLAEIMARADEIKGKVGENLRATLTSIPLSQTLARIKCDVELSVNINQLKLSRPDTEALKTYFQLYEFKRWLRELLSDNNILTPQNGLNSTDPNSDKSDQLESVSEQQKTPDQKSNYQIVTSKEEFTAWLTRLKNAALFAFDTETTSLDYIVAEIVGVSFSIAEGEAAYVPCGHDYAEAPEQLDRSFVLQALKPVLENARYKKVGQNLKYDMNVLARYDIHLAGIEFDTMLESYVLNSVGSRHDMDTLALKYLGHKTIHFEDVAGKGAKQLSFNQVAIEQAGPYAAEDADITLRLHHVMWTQLKQQESLSKIFSEFELPLIAVLSRMELNGVLIDKDLLALQSVELSTKLKALVDEAHVLAGECFNLASPKQIQKILFEDQRLPIIKKTPKGQPSTAEDVLQELALDYPLPRILLEHRGLSKLLSTYVDKLPLQISDVTGRVHTSYHQAVAATGRLSSSDPNLQNIPIRTAEGRRIRQAFIAAPGYKILAADYSQIELRIMAHLSQDQRLLQAFNNGEDIHRITAAQIMNILPEQVSSEQRRHAKAVNFGLIYGMSAFGLGKQLGIERKKAQAYINQYFDEYPGVKVYMDNTREIAREKGYVETLFGRRLYLPDINASNHQRRQYAERTAINAPMQGSAADIIKQAMISVDQWIQQESPELRLIMQVHDELVFEIKASSIDSSVIEISHRMQHAASLSVPLIVDHGVGDNWDEAH